MAQQTKTKVDEFGRICTWCHVYKFWVDFDFTSDGRGIKGHFANCRECRRKKNKGRKDQRLWESFGIGLHEFNLMFQKQNGSCFICERKLVKTKDEGDNYACVDHCHNTGKIRGLLCNECNRILGYIEKQRHLLPKFLTYLDGD